MPASLSGPPHVLITADAVGGLWSYATDLARGLLMAGVEVTLAVIGPRPCALQKRQVGAIAGLRLQLIDGPLDWMAPSDTELRPIADQLARLADEIGADLVHLNSPALAGLARFGKPVLGACHSCTASWWTAVKASPLPADFAWRRDVLAHGYAACDLLTAPSRAFARATLAHYGVEPLVTLNGRRAPAATGSGRRQPVALTASRLWDEGKNLKTLDRAAAALQHRVVALGALSGPGEGPIVLPHLETPGRQSPRQVAGWMGRAAVFVSPALYEPFGLAVLEAAQSGMALVLSDIPTFRELWDGAASFTPARDAEALAAAMAQLLDHPAERQLAAERARARAARYSLEAMTTAVLHDYVRLAPHTFAPLHEAAAA